MAEIHELLGLDESGRAVKAQNPPAQAAENKQNGANSAPGSSSSQKNDGDENGGPRSLVTIPNENRASDVTRFEVTEQRDKNNNVITPAQDVRIGHLNPMPNPLNTREDVARYNNDRLISIAREGQAAKAREDAQKNQKKHMTYSEMVDQLYPEQAEARRKADDEKAAKKRRREAVISALGDGLTTIANLGSVIGGANPVSHETLSERSQARWDKIQADKDARRDAYRAARLRAQQADQEREDALAAAERAAKNRAEDNAREDAYRIMQLKNQRDIAGLRTDAQKDIAQGNWANRKEVANINQSGANWRSQYKATKSGGPKYGYEWIEQYNPLTGKNDYRYVTGNAAMKYYRDLEGEDSYTEKPDGLGGTQRETKVNGNSKANAKHTRENHKQKGGKGGKPGNHPQVKI